MKSIRLHDKSFEPYLDADKIEEAVTRIATEINRDFPTETPLFLGILNGAFMFAADLFKKLEIPAEISFLKVASYEGVASSGKIKELIGLNQDLQGRTVIVLEDIVDTGHTLQHLTDLLAKKNPAAVKIATLLLKPDAYNGAVKIDYCGMEIPNEFIVGYGLDYNGLGRNLPHIYKIIT